MQLCHAYKCDVEVPSKSLMCHDHYYKVPIVVRREIWKSRKLNKKGKLSAVYVEAIAKAILAVAIAEGYSLREMKSWLKITYPRIFADSA